MAPQQRITFNPNPPVAGQPLQICYDFSGLTLTKTTLRVTFSPGGSPKDYDVTPDSNCVTVNVPANGEGILVEDLGGPSPDKTAVIDRP